MLMEPGALPGSLHSVASRAAASSGQAVDVPASQVAGHSLSFRNHRAAVSHRISLTTLVRHAL